MPVHPISVRASLHGRSSVELVHGLVVLSLPSFILTLTVISMLTHALFLPTTLTSLFTSSPSPSAFAPPVLPSASAFSPFQFAGSISSIPTLTPTAPLLSLLCCLPCFISPTLCSGVSQHGPPPPSPSYHPTYYSYYHFFSHLYAAYSPLLLPPHLQRWPTW